MAVGVMSSLQFLLYFVTLFINVLGTEHVPVLIWESSVVSQKDTYSPPFLSKLSSDDFSDYIMKKVSSHKSSAKPVIVAFVEENLSLEDFSWEDTEERGPFSELENLATRASTVGFLPSVHAPLKGLKKLGYRWQIYRGSNDTEDSLPEEGGVVLVVKLGDAKVEEDRPDFLRRHDHIIGDIYNQLLVKYPNIIALYTSHHTSWVEPADEPSIRRVRNLLAVDEPETYWHDKDNNIMLYSPNLPTMIILNGSEPIQISSNDFAMDNRTQFQRLIVSVTVTSTRRIFIRLRFTLSDSNYWSISEIEYEDQGTSLILKTSSDIYAPVGFSYHCSNITFRNSSVSLNFTNVQMQPFLKEGKFGDSYDCVWFFTVPIWSGLFVTAILAIIMIWGLTMILDIKTMDQFDDPKGKTITINTSE